MPDIAALRARLEIKYSYLHFVFAFLRTPADSGATQAMSAARTWLATCSDEDMAAQGFAIDATLEQMLSLAHGRLSPKKPWHEIATEYLQGMRDGDFSLSIGIPHGWLTERFDTASLGGPPDLPYHARVGLGAHSGKAAVEEEFLLRDAFFLLGKCNRALAYLEKFRGTKPGPNPQQQYRVISSANQNVATYARFAVTGFYAFVECFVNSVGEDFTLRNPKLDDTTKALLRGMKGGRYLSIEKKIEVFPGLIRTDGKRPIVLSDPGQIIEPYKAFAGHIKELRDASVHYAKSKSTILMSPQAWNQQAKDAAHVCVAVAQGFWGACYPTRTLPLYLGAFDVANHIKIAEARIDGEFAGKPEPQEPPKDQGCGLR